MFYDKIKNISNYKGISKNLDKAIDYIIAGTYKTAPKGKTVIDGDNIFFMVQDYTTKNPATAQFETHNVYADIQILLKGTEGFGFTFEEALTETVPHSLEKDIAFQSGKPKIVPVLREDNFVFVFPKEAHMPGLTVNNTPCDVTKVVFKIKL